MSQPARTFHFAAAAIVALATARGAGAAILTVGPAGAYASIQAAVDAAIAAPGADEIRVQQGTYRERVVISGADLGVLTLSGGWLAGFGGRAPVPAAATIVDGERMGSTLSVEATGVGDLTVDGFTWTGGRSGSDTSGAGVALRVGGHSAVTLRGNVVERNEAVSTTYGTAGGGIGVYAYGHGRFLLRDSRIRDNTATASTGTAVGGGLHAVADGAADVEIVGNTVTGNATSAADNQATGGGVYLRLHGDARGSFTDNRIERNDADGEGVSDLCAGGCLRVHEGATLEARRNRWLDNRGPEVFTNGVSLSSSGSARLEWSDDLVAGGGWGVMLGASETGTLHATNVTVADNASTGIVVLRLSDGSSPGGRLTVFNSIAFGNGSDTDIPAWVETGSNLFGVDPRFADRVARNYRLLPGSPAIDAGNDAPPGGLGPRDVENLPRRAGAHVDRGAHETQSGRCRVERFGEVPIPAAAPVCSCLRNDFYRSFRCGFFFPDLFIDLTVPVPLPPPGQPAESRWTIHPGGPVDGPFQLTAALIVGGQEVPVQGTGMSGKLAAGRDAVATLRYPVPSTQVPLRVKLRHLPPGAQQPLESVTEILVGPPPSN
jgi:hypothetical protein